jgi:hypothetical protein
MGTTAAFAAGVVVGWVGRSAVGSTRDLFVGLVVRFEQARDFAQRTAAEQREWLEDLFAEGRARVAASAEPDVPLDEGTAPRVDRRRARARTKAANA